MSLNVWGRYSLSQYNRTCEANIAYHNITERVRYESPPADIAYHNITERVRYASQPAGKLYYKINPQTSKIKSN